MNTIGDLSKSRDNNLDFIRLMAAVLVVFSHSFPLSMGYINGHDPDPLSKLTGGPSFGTLAVMIFFVISGFLITQSFERSKNPIHFIKCRILRILPGLVFVTVFTIVVLGPIVTSLKLNQYFGSKLTWSYLKNMTLVKMNYNLPGVFEDNIYGNTINGSIWTLVYEFKCYFLVLVLGMTKLLRKTIIFLLFIIATAAHILGFGGANITFVSYFAAGMVVYMFREYIKLSRVAALLSTLIIIICLWFYQPYFLSIIAICITYTTMYLAYHTRRKVYLSRKIGDLSYGTYIFAFPIQQAVTYYFGGHMTWWLNFLISLPIIMIMAAFSWHFVEKNALKLKNVSLNRTIKKILKVPVVE